MRAGWALLVAVLFRVLRRVYRILSWIDYGLSFFRKPSQIVSVWPETPMVFGPRIAIFVHFDGQGLVREHTLHYVAALRDAGLSVLFVTNSGKLLPVAMDKLRPLCAGVLVRRNIGYDFGAMREGLEYLKLPRPDTEMVVIANDSIYGPLGPLSDIIARVDFTKADFWAWGAFAIREGRVIQTRAVKLVKADSARAEIEINNDWTVGNRKMVDEVNTAVVTERDGVFVIDLDYRLTPSTEFVLNRASFGGFDN